VALQERLELVADCWNLLDVTGGQSRRGLYLPQGSKEPEAAYRQRLANARPSGFFRDALRTYAGMLASVQWRDLLTWTPKTDPMLMRASPPARIGKEKPHESQTPQPRADHPQVAHC